LLAAALTLDSGAQSLGPPDSRAAGYEDRLIEGGSLPADVSSGETVSDASGWPRSIRAEAITSRVVRNDYEQDESGLRLNAMLDTPNFGALTFDANVRGSSGQRFGSDNGTLVTLYQMGMPMDGGWRVNNTLGVTNAPTVGLARQQQRFWVPSILHNGVATEWLSPAGLQLQASVGQPGLLTGLYVRARNGTSATVCRPRCRRWPSRTFSLDWVR
jgi:hypothetical protein